MAHTVAKLLEVGAPGGERSRLPQQLLHKPLWRQRVLQANERVVRGDVCAWAQRAQHTRKHTRTPAYTPAHQPRTHTHTIQREVTHPQEEQHREKGVAGARGSREVKQTALLVA